MSKDLHFIGDAEIKKFDDGDYEIRGSLNLAQIRDFVQNGPKEDREAAVIEGKKGKYLKFKIRKKKNNTGDWKDHFVAVDTYKKKQEASAGGDKEEEPPF